MLFYLGGGPDTQVRPVSPPTEKANSNMTLYKIRDDIGYFLTNNFARILRCLKQTLHLNMELSLSSETRRKLRQGNSQTQTKMLLSGRLGGFVMRR